MCHQNKRMTNHKQNCSQKLKKKKERKIKEETQKKVLDFFTNN